MGNSKSTAVSGSAKTDTPPPKNPPNQRQISKSVHQKTPTKEDKLNQSFSKLNQSMTSSQHSQYLTIPNQQDIIKQQKLKQQKLM